MYIYRCPTALKKVDGDLTRMEKMKQRFNLKMLILNLFVWAAAQVASAENFVCDPPAEIVTRVNAYCIQATDFTVEHKEPVQMPIKNGTLYFRTVYTEFGQVVLKVAHKCQGKSKTQEKSLGSFCGYQKAEIDRKTPAIVTIRQEIAKQYKLSEKEHQAQIDAHMAKQMNPWLSDAKDNIEERDGVVKVKILKNVDGITCHTPQELVYETNCK